MDFNVQDPQSMCEYVRDAEREFGEDGLRGVASLVAQMSEAADWARMEVVGRARRRGEWTQREIAQELGMSESACSMLAKCFAAFPEIEDRDYELGVWKHVWCATTDDPRWWIAKAAGEDGKPPMTLRELRAAIAAEKEEASPGADAIQEIRRRALRDMHWDLANVRVAVQAFSEQADLEELEELAREVNETLQRRRRIEEAVA